ncbi:MAG: non-heme iron oxygenase ferredoxin subunit [bacterium]|nr:non-heme iron oxygenase ferredoxin subunit [bacterium]
MEDFVPVGHVADLSPGQMTWVSVQGERVLLANVEGVFYALEDVCGHQRQALSRGKLEDYAVECPLHFARFDVRTGELISGPLSDHVLVYEVRLEGETVYVKREPNEA